MLLNGGFTASYENVLGVVWTLNDWKIVSSFRGKHSHWSHSEKQSNLLCDLCLSHQTFYLGKKIHNYLEQKSDFAINKTSIFAYNS